MLLAYATAHKAGSEQAAEWMDETWDLLEERFWDAEAGLYRDEADADWHFSTYRGQNANMHMCEAMLCAYEASGNPRYLDRALLLADHMTRRQAGPRQRPGLGTLRPGLAGRLGLQPRQPKHLFRPWGFQPGHQTEWAKLLLILDRHCRRPAAELGRIRSACPVRPEPDVASARASAARPAASGPRRRADRPLLDPVGRTRAASPEIDAPGPGLAGAHGDVACSIPPCRWPGTSATAACATASIRTATSATTTSTSGSRPKPWPPPRCWRDRTDIDDYWLWYERIWTYAWQHMVDHQYGGWYRILDRMNQKYDNKKSPAGKTDYHTMGACYEVLNVIDPG